MRLRGCTFLAYHRVLRIRFTFGLQEDSCRSSGDRNGFQAYDSDSMVIEGIRVSVGKQYPALMPTLFPGTSMTAVKPLLLSTTCGSLLRCSRQTKPPRSMGKYILFGLLLGAFRKLSPQRRYLHRCSNRANARPTGCLAHLVTLSL